MKKIISLVLVLVMVLSLTVFASAASFSDIYNSKNEEAIEELYELNILKGYSLSKFGPHKELTRAEAATIIVRAMIEDEDIYSTPGEVFTDVNINSWYEEYVETAYRNDLIHGYGKGKFGPADKVTYAQFATMVLNMLGYDATRLAGTWPENVVNRADNMDLYYKVSAHKNSDAILREDVAQMIYNALDCEMVVWSHGKFEFTGWTLRGYLTQITSPIDEVITITTDKLTNPYIDVNSDYVFFNYDNTTYYCPIDEFDTQIQNGDTVKIVYNVTKDMVLSVEFVSRPYNPDVIKVGYAVKTKWADENTLISIKLDPYGEFRYDEDGKEILDEEMFPYDPVYHMTIDKKTQLHFYGVDKIKGNYVILTLHNGEVINVDVYPNADAYNGSNTIPEGEQLVCWISAHGTCYHKNSECSNMANPIETNIFEAKNRGFTPCEKCYN